MLSWQLPVLLVNLLAATAVGDVLPYSPPPTGKPPIAVQLKDGAIVSSSGERIDIKAAVWDWGTAQSEPFSSFVHINKPESTGNCSISRALVAAAHQLRHQGYNAVYLPFSLGDLLSGNSSSSSSSSSRSQRCTQVSLASLRQGQSGEPAASASQTGAGWLQKLAQRETAAGTKADKQAACLSLLPETTTMDRFLWSVQWFLANGLYVVLSNDMGSATAGAGVTCSNSSSTCALDTGVAADAWARLWKAVVALPSFEGSVQGRVMLQLASDPHSSIKKWESTSDITGKKRPGLQELYLAILNAVDRVKPGSAVFILQGPQQQGPSDSQWGTGFSADPQLLRQGVTDPTPFLKALSSKPYRNQIILAPRIFSTQPSSSSSSRGHSLPSNTHTALAGKASAEVDHSDEPQNQGSDPSKVLDSSFRQLSQVGFCVSEGSCIKFPVAVMQQGQRPSAQQQQQQGEVGVQPDLQLFADFVLSTQEQQKAAAVDAVTGSWYHWDLMSGTDQGHGSIAQGQPKHSTSSRTGSSKAASSSTRSTGGQAGAAAPQHEHDAADHGGILTFVYNADSASGSSSKEGGMVFDIRELQADDAQQ